MDAWRSFSIEEELARIAPFSVTLCNDATSACAAEFFFGEAGGAAISSTSSSAPSSAAGWSSMARSIPAAPATPPPSARCRSPRPRAARPDLTIDLARFDLSTPAADRGGGTRSFFALAHTGDLGRFRPVARRLDREAAYALAYASLAAMSVIDVEAIIIDGAMPSDVRERLRLRVAAQVDALDRRGLSEAKSSLARSAPTRGRSGEPRCR